MKQFSIVQRWPVWLLATATALLHSHNALATSAFSSSATITYTIDSVINTTNPGNTDGFYMNGSFGLEASSSEVVIPVGSDAALTPLGSIADDFVSPVVGSYRHSLNVSGSVNDGTADAYYLGLFELFLGNESSDSFDIQVTVSYQLDTAVSGQFAVSDIQLDFANENEAFEPGLSQYVSAATPFDLTATLPDSDTYNFTLGAFDSEFIYADVAMSASLEASSVPVPGAIWLFASALILPGVRKFRHA